MTAVSAEKVKELREKSGAGIMDCKRALAAAEGDFHRAIELLRKEGIVKAARKAGRAAQEGLVGLGLSSDRRLAALAEINCETDFVARTDPFQNFVSSVTGQILQSRPRDVAELLRCSFQGAPLEEALTQLIAQLGENIKVRRFRWVSAGEGEVLGAYLHTGSKIGTIVRLKGVDEEVAREIAMHVAALSPHYLSRQQVPPNVLEGEKEILRSSPEMMEKPSHLRDRILEGRLNRYFAEICLLDQPFVKDPTGKKTVGGYLREKGPSEVLEMVRLQVGEE